MTDSAATAMKPIGVLYATREGQTQRVAEQIVARLRERGLDAVALDLGKAQGGIDPHAYRAVIVAASVHIAEHEPEIIDFVRQHRASLTSVPNAFLSVTLSEAGVERKDTTPEEHARFAADVRAMIDKFIAETGWQPAHVVPVAGALRYSKYNFAVRMLMKRIAREAKASTDTSRDHEYTDWRALEDFVDRFAAEITPGNTERR